MRFPTLKRRAEAFGFLGLAALAAAPIRALEQVIEQGRWYHSNISISRRS
jgi:hypothetical protein